jgi:NADH pyrophosphatase NudC (nudix superfamily)
MEEGKMAQDSGELKARMMAEAEKVIERMLAEREKKKELQLSDIERMARVAGEQMMERFANEMAAEEGQQESTFCPGCGRKMRYKGHKARDVATEAGEVRLERAYYYCPQCKVGIFPPRPSMETE